MSKGAYINEEGTLVVDMAEADKLWNSLTKDQQFAAMSAMFDPLLERAKELSEEVEAQAARIRELEAAQDVAVEALAPFASYIDKRTCKITMIWEDGDYRSTYTDTLKPSDFFKAFDALRALAGQGGE